MAIIERHTSPDNSMVLIVESSDNDLAIGFEGYTWHTHGDILNAWGYEGSPEKRTRAFIDDIVESRRVIAIVRIDGAISDICIPDDMMERPLSKSFNEYAPPNEKVDFRYWNGQPAIDE